MNTRKSRLQAAPSQPPARAAGTRRQAGREADAPGTGKLLPPRGPVDVPRQPPRRGAGSPDEAAADSRPARDNRDESNWADGSKPQPHAKNARTHLF